MKKKLRFSVSSLFRNRSCSSVGRLMMLTSLFLISGGTFSRVAEVNAQTFTETFDTGICSPTPCTVTGFSRTLGGVHFDFTFTADGDGGDFAHNTTNIDMLSGDINTSTTERVTITRNDNRSFIFTSIHLDNGSTFAEDVTITGKLAGVVIETQMAPSGSNATWTFGSGAGIEVDEIEIISTAYENVQMDNFTGDIPAPDDVAPVLTVNTGITLNEGATETIDSGELQANDTDTNNDNLVYSITTGPARGQLELTTGPGVAVSNFTQAQLNANQVVYVHDDSNTTSDSFTFDVQDGSGSSLTEQTFSITINPVGDDTPTLDVNTGITLNEGTTETIDSGELQSSDVDTDNDHLIYSITTGPASGQLESTTGPGVAISSFTQAQLNANQVVYVHDGSNTTSDSFTFDVQDGSGSNLTEQTFSITINPVDDDTPTLEVNTGITLNEGATETIDSGELQANDTDTNNDNLVYSITTGPASGQLELTTGPGVAISSFTQAQLSANQVVYVHDDSNTTSDSFTFDVQDGSGNNLTGQTFSITISSINDVPSLTTVPATIITATSATMGGEVTDNGGEPVTDRGIVWSTASNPNVDDDHKVEIGDGLGVFSTTQNLLPFGTTIYFRAYATNGQGTAYGNEISFITNSETTAMLTGNEGWRLLSTPAHIPLQDFLEPVWTQGASTGGDTGSGDPNVFTWDLNATNNDRTWWEPVTDLTGTTLTAGQGLLVYVYEDPDSQGPLLSGFPYTLSVTGSEHTPAISPSMNTNTDGWSLLGNPFASPVQFSQITPLNTTGIVYVWDPNDNTGDGGQSDLTSGSWKTWNGSLGDLSNGLIAPFQGFFVQNSATGAAVSFTQESKSEGSPSFLGKQKDPSFVRLKIDGNEMRNTAWLEFSSHGSLQTTEGDAHQLEPLSKHYALLASRKTDGALMDIGRYPLSENIQIPLVTEVTRPGAYTLTVTDAQINTDLFINDLQTGESIPLQQGASYVFTIEQTAKTTATPLVRLNYGLKKKTFYESRFEISSIEVKVDPARETPGKFVLEQNYPNPFNPTTQITYQLPYESEVRLEVYDLTGRQITTLFNGQKEAGSHTINFNASNLSSGVYIYRLQAGSTMLTKKLTVMK